MRYRASRRQFLAGSAAAVAVFPMPAIAQNAPLKIGLLTVKTGPLAAGGIHFEEGISSFLKDKNFTLSGRKIDLIVADTGGNPAGAKNKAQEVVERDKVDIVLGPFAAFELLATVDYLAQAKIPTLAFAGAEDVTQAHIARMAAANHKHSRITIGVGRSRGAHIEPVRSTKVA